MWEEAKRKKEEDEYGEEAGSAAEEVEEKEPPVKPEYNEAEMLAKFDDDFPEIVIPPEVVDMVHNDWVLGEDEEAKLIDEYWQGKPE